MMNYFANKEALSQKAIFKTKERAREYAAEIENSVNKTTIFSGDIYTTTPDSKLHTPDMSVVQADSVSTIFKYTTDSERVCVLNFASFKNPGGMFINGSSAQEESLCHASILYNVLREFPEYYDKNNKDKNRGLYHNRALYSEDVVFFDNTSDPDKVGEMRLIDVLTCAAPNAGCFLRYNTGEGAIALNEHILADRIVFMHTILNNAVNRLGLDTVILGAWGCGVFRQNPGTVANLMMTEFKSTQLKRVIFGVPDDGTYAIFANALKLI